MWGAAVERFAFSVKGIMNGFGAIKYFGIHSGSSFVALYLSYKIALVTFENIVSHDVHW
jgi:hypothetical protein